MPIPSIESAFPSDIESPLDEVIQKSVVICHDESTFQANDEENWMWGEQGQCILKPKSRGSGIMVSDFIDEHNGYLWLTDEFIQAVDKVDGLQKDARTFLECGKEREGYWPEKRFLSQLSKLLTSNILRKRGTECVLSLIIVAITEQLLKMHWMLPR